MYIGFDFGTTNSGAAVFDGSKVRAFPLDPSSQDPTVVRSTIYITREHEVYIGKEAVDTYYSQNIGRPVRLERQYVGEIEMTFAELGTFVRDVHVLVDTLAPGRLLRSLKSGLATNYEGTAILGRYYGLEELIALYLRELRTRMEQQADEPVDGIVLGRPVHFAGSHDDGGNQRAVSRLRKAAMLAGFEHVRFELEPVAAALHYELTVSEPQNIVVFDFGGGTLDITVMRVGEQKGRHVFSTGGVGIAGDVFDQRILERLLLGHFGRGSTYGEDGIRFPDQYTDALLNWQTVLELNRPETLRFLEQAQLTGSHPARVRALESLLVSNHAMRMFDEVEEAKIRLSKDFFALIHLTGHGLDIWQPITRSQFEALIAEETRRIELCLQGALSASGLKLHDIDAVVRTGGSAQIPLFIDMLDRMFPAKVVQSDVFGSVTAGLAVRAYLDHHGSN